MAGNDAGEGLAGLNEGLRVRHIATFGLAKCAATDDPNEVLGRDDLRDFDQIPVHDGTQIVGILERATGKCRPLDESVLVSADDPLSHFIHTVHEQPYRLVVEGTAITGIVTWSDIAKVPVLVLGYCV